MALEGLRVSVRLTLDAELNFCANCTPMIQFSGFCHEKACSNSSNINNTLSHIQDHILSSRSPPSSLPRRYSFIISTCYRPAEELEHKFAWSFHFSSKCDARRRHSYNSSIWMYHTIFIPPPTLPSGFSRSSSILFDNTLVSGTSVPFGAINTALQQVQVHDTWIEVLDVFPVCPPCFMGLACRYVI